MAMVQRFRASKLATLSLLTATFLATAHDVNAQLFPSRVITIVVPTAPARRPISSAALSQPSWRRVRAGRSSSKTSQAPCRPLPAPTF